MAVIYDKELSRRPVFQVLGAGRYWSRKFTYPRIWQYHITEKTMLGDLGKIPVGSADFSKRATVIFRHHPRSKVVTPAVLAWVMTQIAARLVLSEEIVWCAEESDSLSRRRLEVLINVPVKRR